VAVQGKKRSPVANGESPRANWKNWLIRKAAEKMDAAMRNWVTTAEENATLRKSPRGIIG
jgi:hypothetical protein